MKSVASPSVCGPAILRACEIEVRDCFSISGSLGDVRRDAPRLVAGEQCAHVYAPARLLRVGFE